MIHAKYTLDLASLVTAISTVLGILPPLAALASLIWTGIQVWDWWHKKNA